MNTQILILVDYLHFLRNDLNRTSSLNLDTIQSLLTENGFTVEIKSFQEITKTNSIPKNKFIWYASSDFASYKAYIEDILHYIKQDNHLIPPFDILRAHNNKGYQYLLRKKLALPSLIEYYFGTYEELDKIIGLLKFPIVLKKPSGAGSINVRLIRSRSELVRVVKKLSRKSTFITDLLKRQLKRYIFTHKYTYDNSRESLYYGNFILQEFIPGLKNDWKVLVFYDKYYVLEREVRSNDFRASGSGKWFYRDFEPGLLDFSKEIFEKLHTPWISLDICFDGHSYQLLEFQGVNFGPVTLQKAPYYFILADDNRWQKIEEPSDLSSAYAHALVKYIKRFYT